MTSFKHFRGFFPLLPVFVGAGVLVVTGIVTLGQPALLPPQWPRVFLSDVEQLLLEMVNEERIQRGIASLQFEPKLMEIARAHTTDMMERRFFAHDNPDGEGPADRVARAHRQLIGTSAENLWRGSRSDIPRDKELAEDIMDSLMNSPGHRVTILAEDLTHLGVGVSREPGLMVNTWETRATQLFAEVAAYTKEPVPESLGWAALANFSITLGGREGDAELFDLWSPDENRSVFGPVPVRMARLLAQEGMYQIRFYFRQGSGHQYVVHFGPRLEIR